MVGAMPRDATQTENRALAFCEDYARTHGRAPTVRELMEGIGVQNPTGASRALRKHVQATYEKAFASNVPGGLDAQLLQRIQELQDAAAEVGHAELERERVAFEALKAAKDEEVDQAHTDRDLALKKVETTHHELAVFEARTGEEIAAKGEQIAALTRDLTESAQQRKDVEQALAKAREDVAETTALLRQAKATAAQQLLDAEERQEAALKQQAASHSAVVRKRDEDILAAHRERRRAEDNLVIANTKLGLSENTLEQLRKRLEATQALITAKAVADQAAADALVRACKAEAETVQLRSDGLRSAEALARLEAELEILRKQAEAGRPQRPGKR